MTFDLVYWDHSYNAVLLLNLAIIIGLFASLRLFSGTISHINASDELLKKDNPAFGLSLAGVTLAVTIMLSGTIYGDFEDTLLGSAVAVGLYGIIGIILMAVTRLIFDKVALPHISLRDEIVKGNMAVAIADTANVLAAAIIIRAVMVWIASNTLEALLTLLALYAVSQVILTGVTFLRLKTFKATHAGRSIEDELKNGNTALALSFAGGKIMTALAIAVASQLVVYELYAILPVITAWAVVSIIFIVLLKFMSLIAERLILFQVNITQEILEQRNVAVGALQAVIYIAMGILVGEF